MFLTEEWEGELMETEEMKPQWFRKDEISFNSMWSNDKHWFPKVLEGLVLRADFMFKEGNELLDFELLE